MSRVALASSEEIEKLSNGFGKMGRECRMSRGSNHNVLLFGSESVFVYGFDDPNELREEDIWGEEENPSWDHHLTRQKEDTCETITEKNSSSKVSSKSRRSWLSIQLQEAGQKNGQGGVGFASLESAQNGYGGGHGGGKKDSNGGWAPGFSTRKVSIPLYGNGGGGGGAGGYSNGWHEHEVAMAKGGVPQSAPVSVPVWAKSHVGKPVEAEEEDKDEDGDGGEGDEEDGDGRLPPHEIVAREYAKSQSTTFSVIEGAGRTLKGMDLRRVRNSVWRRTGFVD